MSTTRRVLAALAVPAALIGLTGCDSDEVGAAAIVGDERITVSELQDHAREIVELPGSPDVDIAELQTELIMRDVQGAVLDEMAQEHDIEISEAQVDTFIDEQVVSQAPDGDVEAFAAQNRFTPDGLREFVRTHQLLAQQLIAEFDNDTDRFNEAFIATAEELGVEVNPRYGEWEGVELNPISGSVSVPADGAEAGATP